MQEKKIHLLVFDTSKLNEQDYIRFLNDEELAHYSQLKLADQKKNYAISRGALRQKISECFSLPLEKIGFSKTANGKPFCNNSINFSFNVSHTDKYAVIAYCLEEISLGVDSELKTRVINTEKLAKKNCHSIEQQQLFDAENKPEHFLKLWTLKESYIKMLGEKISSLPLSGFAFELSSKIMFHPPKQDKTNIFFCLYAIDDLIISIAVESGDPKIVIQETNLNQKLFKLLLSS